MLEAGSCRVEPMVTHPAPPQTCTCAITAYGSSSRASATHRCPLAYWCQGWYAQRLSSSSHPWATRLDGAFPPVGRLGLTSPLAPGLCAATTAALSLSGAFACRSFPDTLRAPLVRGIPTGLAAGSKRPDRARAFGHPVPQAGHDVKETGGSPKFPSAPSEDMPRSQTPVVSCALAKAHPGRLPSSHWTPSATPNTTSFGAQ
jgi:hypothetical protein